MPLRTYEALYIVSPNLTDDEVQTIARGVEKLITDDGGAIVRSEIWSKRRLAYPIKKFAEGIYVLVRFECEPDTLTKLKSSFRLEEQVLREQVVYFDQKTLRLEALQAKRSEEQLMARSTAGAGRRSHDDDDDDRPKPSFREPKVVIEEPTIAAVSIGEVSDAAAAISEPSDDAKTDSADEPEQPVEA